MDFGLIVDGAVVMIENSMRRLAEQQHKLGRVLTAEERLHVLHLAPLEVARPVAFGVGIILIVFLPILALEGVEGKMFKPMALTMIFALAGSLVLALTLVPVLASLLLPKRVKDQEPLLVRLAHFLYAPSRTRRRGWSPAPPSSPCAPAANSCPNSASRPSSAPACASPGFRSRKPWPKTTGSNSFC